MSDMAIAMSEAGTVASSYRVSIEDLSAMIGTMESVTKLGGSEVGHGIKSILINLQNINSSKIVNTLDDANASMTEFVNGTEKLRDPISILRDLAKTFNQLDEDDALRAEILTNIGGKHQAVKLAALLQNMELFDKMLVDYSEGAGSAMEEAMKSANNWSGKLNQIQNSWDSLVNSLTNKKAVLGGLTFFDKLIQGAESAVDTLGEIPVVLTTINTAMTAMKKDYGITQLVNPETKKLDIQGNLFGIDFTSIKNQRKHFSQASEEIKYWNKELRSGKADLDSFSGSLVQNNAQFKAYLQTTSKDTPASLNGYKAYLQQTGQATEGLRIKTILLNAALTMLGSIAVQAVITGIANAFDKFNETVEESQEKIDDINSKISDLKSQIEELNNLEYKSDFDNQKISQLERELELQEKILGIEQKRLYQNQIGTSFSDYFDADSLITKQQAEYDHNNKENYANLSRGYNTYKSSLEDIDSQLASLQEKLNSDELIGRDRFITEGKIAKLTEKRNTLLEKQQTIEDQLTLNMGEYLQNYQTAQETVDSGLLTGSDLEKAESMAEYWNQMYQDSSDIVTNIQKMNGTYDNTNDLLEGMFGGISRDDLASLSDDDKRIALSFDPDNTIGFDELKKRITETKGDIEGLNDTPISFDQAWADSFTSENDAVKELGNNLLELAEQGRLTIEIFNNADAAGYFKNLGISADEAVSKINKLVDESKQLSSMSEQISSMAEALGTKLENGFAGADILSGFDVELRGLESWDRFQSVLGSTTSSYEECQEAANALATEWVNSSDFLAQLTEENKEYYETQLESMGIENYEEVISYAQALNEAKEVLSQSSLMLGEATKDEIEALIAEGQYSELTANMILALYDAKIAEQAATIDTSADCANLIALAGDTDRTSQSIQLLIQLMDIYSGLESGAYNGNRLLREEALGEANRIKSELEALANGENEKLEIEPTVKLGNRGKSAASKAGGEAGDAYLKSFEEEYSHLKDMLNRGELSESQYLSRLRSLYTRYFKDRKEYLDEFKKYEDEYLSGMLDLHNKALSGISTLLNRKISAANDAKDASISALQEEKEAAAESYQSQIDNIEKEKEAIDDLIKEKNKKIDSINAEIDAIERESESRKKNIQLEKDQFTLEKMLNQRTTSVYKQGVGFVFEADTSGIRDAREKVREDQEALKIDSLKNEILLIQKEINLLNEKKDALSEEQDRIQKLMDESNKYYDSLIKQQEEYWASMIKNLQQQKSKWEELADIQEIAEAYSAIEQVFGELGYSVNDVLNGSAGAFEDFKSKYISLINDMNSNSSFAEGLSYATGVAEENLGSFLGKTQETANGLDELGKKASELDTVATSMSNASTSASALNTSTEGLNENLTGVSNAINGISTTDSAGNITTLAEAFTALGEAITSVAEALGIGEEVAASGIVDALTAISEISLGDDEEGIIGQFNQLKTAVDSVTSAISGGGSEEGGDKGSSNSSSPSMSEGATEGGSGGLSGAITEMGNTAAETLGEAGGEEGDGVISKFNMLKTAVDNVTTAIGVGGEEGEGSEENANTLIGALQAQYEKATEILPEEKSLFDELLAVIVLCVGALNSMVSAMTSMQNISMPSMSGSVSVGYNGTVGKAFADGTTGFKNLPTTGYKGLPHDEKNALRSEYGQPELTVYPNGEAEVTTQPTMADLPKGTVVFNEEQTKKIMNGDGKAKTVGKAYANGTRPPFSYETFLDYYYNPPVVKAPDQPFDPFSDPTLRGIELFEELTSQGSTLKSIEAHTQEIRRNVSTINTKNIQPSYSYSVGDVHVTCPGVTSQAVMNELGAALNSKFSGLHLDAYQQSMKR